MVVYTLKQRLAKWACDRLIEDADFGKKIIFSDEAHFELGKQNYGIWGTETPHAYIEKPTHPKQVTVWCRFLVQRHNWAIFFFENEQRETVTVNGDRYQAMLNEFLFIKIEERDIGNIWFQQDGTTCHTAEAILDVLRPVIWQTLYMS